MTHGLSERELGMKLGFLVNTLYLLFPFSFFFFFLSCEKCVIDHGRASTALLVAKAVWSISPSAPFLQIDFSQELRYKQTLKLH